MHSAPGFVAPRVFRRNPSCGARPRCSNAGERVAVLIGAGALQAGDEVDRDRRGAGRRRGQGAARKGGACPDDLPFVTGSVGWLGTSASNRMMAECDTLLMVGLELPLHRVPAPDRAGARRADRYRSGTLGLRYPMEVNLVGDSKETLPPLLPLIEPRQDRTWRERVEALVEEWQVDAEQRAEQPADPINPQLLFTELATRLPDDAILAADSGNVDGLVRPPSSDSRGHDSVGVGNAGNHGLRACPMRWRANWPIPIGWHSPSWETGRCK